MVINTSAKLTFLITVTSFIRTEQVQENTNATVSN